MQQQIGRYQVLEEIASGRQGAGYKAFDPQSGQILALKVLHPSLTANSSYLERFRREASLAASIDHPNVVGIFEVGEDNEWHFIAMELLPESLARVIRSGGALRIERATEFAIQIANGLSAAHALGIVHRDIKPQNVLISADGTAKVTDFGIARAEVLPTMTAAGAMLGTPHYMSPEQARGERTDARSDIYSLGCVLYQMLAGELPFKGTTPLAVIRQQIEVRPRRLRELRSDVSRELEGVVERAMEKDPRRRFQSATEMAAALRVIGFGREQRVRKVSGKAPLSGPARAVEPAQNHRAHPSWLRSRARGRMSGLRGFIYGFAFLGIVIAAALVASAVFLGNGSSEIDAIEPTPLPAAPAVFGNGSSEIDETVPPAVDGSAQLLGQEPADTYESRVVGEEAELGELVAASATLLWPPLGDHETLVFEEDFTDWVIGWNSTFGAEVVEQDGNRILHVPTQPEGWGTGHILENGRMSFQFRSVSPDDGSDELLKVATHYTDDDEAHYQVRIWPDRITLTLAGNPETVHLATQDVRITQNIWHLLTLTVLGPRLIVDLDGETVLAHFHEGMPHGAILVQQAGSAYHIDDIQVVVLPPEPSEPIVPVLVETPLEPTLVVYRDAEYPASWDGQLDYIVRGLASRGYQIVDAVQLHDYMISNDVGTCVVFAQDVVPNTVVDDPFAPSSASLIREYMERGGRVVWIKDIPFFYVGMPNHETINIGDEEQAEVLGMRTDRVHDDDHHEVAITDSGARWGLTQTWKSMRPTLDTAVSLAVASGSGNSAAYYINMGGPPLSGFVRLWDTDDDDFVTSEHLDDLDRVCQFHGTPASELGPLFPANGHYYQVVRAEGGFTWPQAKEAAERMVLNGVRGHLATITSREENHWIVANTDLGSDQVWIGGVQEVPNGGPDFDWRWITGEPWSFTNWNSGEPNDAGEDEFYLIIWDPSGTWNDEHPESTHYGYVVEFPFPSVTNPRPIPAESLFRRALEVMSSLNSFRMEGHLVGKHRQGEFEMVFEGEKSGGSTRLRQFSNDPDHETEYERILVPPYIYYSDDPEGSIWYREPMEGTDSFGDSMLNAGLYIFPHPDVPLRFYELIPLGIESIGDVEASHIRVKANWRRIQRWLMAEGRLDEVAARGSGHSPEEFLKFYPEQPSGLLDVWIDEDGFLRKMMIELSGDGGVGHGEFYYFGFNEPIVIHPPDRFKEIPTDEHAPKPILASAPMPTSAPAPSSTPSPTLVPRVRPKQSFGPLIEIGYNNSLHLCGCDREFEDQWEPGRWLYESKWEYYTEYPVALSATFDRPLNLHDEYGRSSVADESGLYTYSWDPDRVMHLSLEPRVVADSGILLSRSVTPETLTPGTTKVLVRASVRLLRSPSVHDIPVRPVGGNLSINLEGDQRYRGMDGIRIVSVSDDTWRDFGPFFDERREYVIEVEAVLENPNSFAVSYLPGVGASIRIDTESDSTPFDVFLPKGFETSSADVSFEAFGLAGEWVRLTFTNLANGNNSWIFEGEFRGITHWWQSAMRPAP